MPAAIPHYLLLTEGESADRESQWRFVLQGLDSQQALAASDTEPLVDPDRADLLAVVRGLEAIEQPARVTLITRSRYVQQGLARGLHEWRENDWQWERFGRLVPVRDSDLWQRIDHALDFHQVDCRCWRFDDVPAEPAHSPLSGPHFLRRRPTRSVATDDDSTNNQVGAEPIRTKQHRSHSPRWSTARFRDLCASAAQSVAAASLSIPLSPHARSWQQ
jgi:ribonuclease HI